MVAPRQRLYRSPLTPRAGGRKRRHLKAKASIVPIVGIGASAGGLEAITQLFSALPKDIGMSFVIVQHLDPRHDSMAPEILSRATHMPVHEIKHGSLIIPNHIYLIPPGADLTIRKRKLMLRARSEFRGVHTSIDSFFQSLADDQGELAIGVILSGSATDGTVGLASIQAAGGVTLVQDPQSARFDGMPRSAVASGVADIILSPTDIAHELTRLSTHLITRSEGRRSTMRKKGVDPYEHSPAASDEQRRIFGMLRQQTKVDFSEYKQATVVRRIQKRMMVRHIDTMAEYVQFLEKHPEEVDALYSDILIHVTEFFRDTESYTAMSRLVLSRVTNKRDQESQIRVWVPGCSTGEEAYSIAILLLEGLGDRASITPLQVFATDISQVSIQKARLGIYPESALKHMSSERLSRHFERCPDGYRVRKQIRDICLFSKHDVTRDPPFSRLDLISCRNLLIYFSKELQKRIIPVFHYALNRNGFLWLGRSESLSGAERKFKAIDKTHRIFSRVDSVASHLPRLSITPQSFEAIEAAQRLRMNSRLISDMQIDADRVALAKYSPPSVLVSSSLEILQFRGRTAPYLEQGPGAPSRQLYRLAKRELLPELRVTVNAAIQRESSVRSEAVALDIGAVPHVIHIHVVPVNTGEDNKQNNLVIFFETTERVEPPLPQGKARSKSKRSSRAADQTQIKRMEQEIQHNQRYRKLVTDAFEEAQHELTGTNDELQSANEELQSTNEELETAKEELQSSNEELTTVNDELQSRNQDLTTLNGDLSNVLSSIEIPMIIVGSGQKIRRYTPMAETVLKLVPSDIGRSLSEIRTDYGNDLATLAAEVEASAASIEREVQDRNGHWHRLQIRPYRTADNQVDGVVIALVDIEVLKHRLVLSDTALKYAAAVADTIQLPFAVIDKNLGVRSANLSFYKHFSIEPASIGMSLLSVLKIDLKSPHRLLTLLQETWQSAIPFKKFELSYHSPELGARTLLISGSQIQWLGAEPQSMLIALEDITERRRTESELDRILIQETQARAEAEQGNAAKDVFLATLSHELRTPVTSILLWAQMLRMGRLDAEKSRIGIETIEQSAKAQGQLIDDLLDVSRIILGKLQLKLVHVDPATVVRAAVDSLRIAAEKKSIRIELSLSRAVACVAADPVRLQQVVWNLLSNAIKFSPAGSQVDVAVQPDPGGKVVRIQVVDRGKGIDGEFLPHIFDRFSQADSSTTRIHGGLGLGLAIVRNLVELQSGTVVADSAGLGHGACFTIALPILPSDVVSHAGDARSVYSAERTPSSAHLEAVSLAGLSVLVVDDEESARDALIVALQSFGADVQAAASTAAALAIMATHTPHVLVSDIAMPGEDGYSLIKQVRGLNAACSSVPALALTAYAGEEDGKRALSVGFQRHIAKPIDVHVLVQAIFDLSRGSNKQAPR